MIGNAKEILQKAVELVSNDPEFKKIYELKEKRRKRSLDANAYYWVLLTKIADELRTSKEELHMRMLREYGQITSVCVPEWVLLDGYIKYFEQDGTFSRGGKQYIVYNVFKPSSEMDSREMSILIDGVVNDAKELGIETLPPGELKIILEAWDEKTNKKTANQHKNS